MWGQWGASNARHFKAAADEAGRIGKENKKLVTYSKMQSRVVSGRKKKGNTLWCIHSLMVKLV